ncbi:MAG: DUF1775 domain-containing protein [Gemmatimonadetes bacterium]|nr:DUF1775 domain-containing protein [Gemmatimonadota bacterium]
MPGVRLGGRLQTHGLGPAAPTGPHRAAPLTRGRRLFAAGILLGLGAAGRPLWAQIALDPPSVTPAAWERFTLRVVNQTDTPTVAVRITLPEAVQVLGVGAPPGFTARLQPATDSSAPSIEWSGGRVDRGAFYEFAFLGRVAPDARPGAELVFPVRLTRASGSTVDWARGGASRAPTVSIRGTTAISPAGAFALAGAATGLAILALVLAVVRRRA